MKDIMNVLKLKQGDLVTIEYDLFQAAVGKMQKAKKIMFDFEVYKKQQRTDLTQGECLLQLFEIEEDFEIDPDDYFSERILKQIQQKLKENKYGISTKSDL